MEKANDVNIGNRLKKFRDKVWGSLKRMPGSRSAARFIRRIPYYHKVYSIVRFESSVPPEEEQRLSDSGFAIREGTEADLQRMEGIEKWDNCSVYSEWLQEGQRFIVAESEREIVAYIWLNFSSETALDHVPEYRLRLTSDAYYGHEAYTVTAHRGKGARRALMIADALAARREGKRFVVTYSHPGPAIEGMFRNFERVGIRRGEILEDVHVMHLAGFRFTWHKKLSDASTVEVVRHRG